MKEKDKQAILEKAENEVKYHPGDNNHCPTYIKNRQESFMAGVQFVLNTLSVESDASIRIIYSDGVHDDLTAKEARRLLELVGNETDEQITKRKIEGYVGETLKDADKGCPVAREFRSIFQGCIDWLEQEDKCL